MVAQLVDSLVAGVLVLVTVTAYLGIAHGALPEDSNRLSLAVAGAIGTAFFTYFGYFAAAEMLTRGGTLGKSALGLRVMRVDGGAPRMTDLAVRNVVRIVDVGLGGVGLLVMFFHPTTRRLGDLAAGTLVVRARPAISLAAASQLVPVLLRTPDAGPLIEGVAQLGSHELSVVRTFLARPNLAPAQRQRLAQGMAERLHDRLGLSATAPERMWPPELFLERLYLQLAERHP